MSSVLSLILFESQFQYLINRYKDKYHMILLICVNKKKKLIYMNLYTKQKYIHRHRITVTKREIGGGIN